MTRIWYNHWFSTAYHLIHLMRECGTDAEFIGSSSNEQCVYKFECDEWYKEDHNSDMGGYAEYCLDFCKKHSIDVFVPRRGLNDIVRNAELFESNGIKLFANINAAHLEITDDKIKTYEYIRDNGLGYMLPPYISCENADEFRNAAEEFKSRGIRVCYKLAVDEGAATFRIIDDNGKPNIYNNSPYHVTSEQAERIVNEYGFEKRIMVMPYLDSPEVSVDCLKTANGLLMLPRYKTASRFYESRFDGEIMKRTEEIAKYFDFEMPFNVQYRMYNGEAVVLEINPRMSGGLQISCAASEINLPVLALRKLLGKSVKWAYPEFKSRGCIQIESPAAVF